jgi:hypothetical protein
MPRLYHGRYRAVCRHSCSGCDHCARTIGPWCQGAQGLQAGGLVVTPLKTTHPNHHGHLLRNHRGRVFRL